MKRLACYSDADGNQFCRPSRWFQSIDSKPCQNENDHFSREDSS